MRRQGFQRPPLGAGLGHHAKLKLGHVTQTAVNDPSRIAARAARKILLLQQRHAQAAQGRVARNARAGDAAADDDQVKCFCP